MSQIVHLHAERRKPQLGSSIEACLSDRENYRERLDRSFMPQLETVCEPHRRQSLQHTVVGLQSVAGVL
jgi:hypothetical protein